jgi:hypothetical protein
MQLGINEESKFRGPLFKLLLSAFDRLRVYFYFHTTIATIRTSGPCLGAV